MRKMTPERLAELRKIAEQADEPHPWFTSDEVEHLMGGTPDDGDFIAAFNPTTALELLDEIEILEKQFLEEQAEAVRQFSKADELKDQLTDAREVIAVLSDSLSEMANVNPAWPSEYHIMRARDALESTREKRERLG